MLQLAAAHADLVGFSLLSSNDVGGVKHFFVAHTHERGGGAPVGTSGIVELVLIAQDFSGRVGVGYQNTTQLAPS